MEALPPSTVVPIHPFETGRFAESFDNVVHRQDGVLVGGLGMSKKALKRYWNGPTCLRDHEVVRHAFDEIRDDIRAGCVFPALRENEIHLYHEGGRLLRIGPRSAYSHGKYVAGTGKADVPLPRRFDVAQYRKIKMCCATHNRQPLKDDRTEYRETWIVSRLFKRFSVWADEAKVDQPKLIDVEVRLRGKGTQMVDLLFLEDDGRLTFVEVKRQYDSRIRSASGTPEVVRQVSDYVETLRECESTVKSAYRGVSSILSAAFCLEPFDQPTDVFCRVPILVCRRDNKPGRDTWLWKRLCHCAECEIDPKYLVVDGGGIEPYAYGDGPGPRWCKDGLWDQLNLKMVFEAVRGAGTLSSVQDSVQ